MSRVLPLWIHSPVHGVDPCLCAVTDTLTESNRSTGPWLTWLHSHSVWLFVGGASHPSAPFIQQSGRQEEFLYCIVTS